jgi:hypothetical protein
MKTVERAPQIPTSISPDGREIWDWAAKLSDHVHRQDKIRRLTADLAGIGLRCGDCDKWMKSRECPRERNENGRQRGPSMNEPKCRQFVEDSFAKRHRAELTEKLAALQSQDVPHGL